MRRFLLALLLVLLPSLASAQTTFTLSVASTNCEFALSCAGLSTTNAPNGTIQVSANASSNTISFETSVNGSTWVAISVTPVGSTTTVTSTTSTGVWTFAAQPLFRARLSTLAGGTTTVTLISTSAARRSTTGTSLPALSDNGTRVISTEAIQAAAGPAGANFEVGENGTGIGLNGSNNLALSSGGNILANLNGTNGAGQLAVGANGQFCSGSSLTPGAGVDTCMARNGAGVMEINSGTNGTLRDAAVRTVFAGSVAATPLSGSVFTAGVTFANLGTPTNGTMILCTDCDPALTMAPCNHVGAQTGAFAFRINGAWICGG